MNSNWKEELGRKIKLVDQALDSFLPAETLKPAAIHQAMRYSIFAGGKRLRPVLVMAAAEAVGGKAEEVLPTACALEIIHTYSLIHDDLPAMDNDDFRRGRPTNHKVFGESMAILAGDALLTIAFEILAKQSTSSEKNHLILQVISEVAQGAGTMGMIGGQVADMEAMNQDISAEQLNYIHTHKTGALFRAAIRSGALLAGANAEQLNALTEYAENLGLAFQITDDILDVEGDPDKIGKDVGSDERNHKATFPAIYGLDEAKNMAKVSVENALTALEGFGAAANLLSSIARYVLARES